MKKIGSALVMLIMLVGIGAQPLAAAEFPAAINRAASNQSIVPAGDNISAQAAEEIVQKAFPELVGSGDFTVERSDMDQEEWNLSCRRAEYRPQDNQAERVYASVNARSGEIIRFYYHPDLDLYRGQKVKLTKTEALQAAVQLIDRLQPERSKKLRYNPEAAAGRLETGYYFYWTRIENGIPVYGDGISVEIDAILGCVTEYQFNWQEFIPPAAQKVIPLAQMEQKLVENIGIYPSYGYVQGSQELRPQYRLNLISSFLDAASGDCVEAEDAVLTGESRKYDHTFVPAQNSATPNLGAGKLTPQEARQIAAKCFERMGYTETLTSDGSKSTGGEERNITFALTARQDKLKLTLDPSGEVRSFTRLRREQPHLADEQAIDCREAVKIARKTIETLNPEKREMVALQNHIVSGPKPHNYFLGFSRLINGIAYPYDFIDVEVDCYTGEVVQYCVSWQNVNGLPGQGLLSMDDALKKYQGRRLLEPVYLLSADAVTDKKFARLVYQVLEPLQLDALRGEFVDSQAEKTNLRSIDCPPEHWSYAALSWLYEGRVLPAGIKAEGKVDRRQGICLLINTISPVNLPAPIDNGDMKPAFSDIKANDPAIPALQEAVQRGIIKHNGNFAPEQELTREELAVWIISCLGYQKAADLNIRVETPFKDVALITPGRENYLGLAAGLGYLSADETGAIRPQAAVSWGEMAAVLARLLPYYR